jgi:hypothetical protein
MVADFRSLGFGSLSAKQEGEKVSEEEQLRRNKECIKKELAEENGEVYVASSGDEAPEIQAQLAVIAALEAKYEADGDVTTYAVAMRGEQIRLANLRREYGNGNWSVAQCRPMLQNEVQTQKFTTSFICPKQCLFEQYSIFQP